MYCRGWQWPRGVEEEEEEEEERRIVVEDI